jgi:ketosteroid isomerase-like protein
MSRKALPLATPEDAEAAFYEAIKDGDIEAMMGIWAEDEEIVCTHPGGARLVGQNLVRASWQAIFQSGTRMTVHVSHQVSWHSALMSVRNVIETIHPADGSAPHGPLVATNVYVLGKQGWRLLAHHASPAAALPRPHDSNDDNRVLH